jgi:hypothetical protein
MGFIGLALLGVVLGAAGTGILHAKNPQLVQKVEEAAKRFVDRFASSRTAEEETEEE